MSDLKMTFSGDKYLECAKSLRQLIEFWPGDRGKAAHMLLDADIADAAAILLKFALRVTAKLAEDIVDDDSMRQTIESDLINVGEYAQKLTAILLKIGEAK